MIFLFLYHTKLPETPRNINQPGKVLTNCIDSFPEDGEYSSNPKDARADFDILPRESSLKGSKKSHFAKRFTKEIFTAGGKAILDKVITDSKLIHGIRTGKLDPHYFARFELQDDRYLTEGMEILVDKGNILKGSGKYPGFPEICFTQASKYDKHRQIVLNKYSMAKFDCVIPNSATTQYVEFLRNDPRIQKEPQRLLYTMLACSHSWRYISRVILPKVDPENVYKEKWLEPNFRKDDYESELEIFLNNKYEEKMFTQEEIEILVSLYSDAMKNEANFIRFGREPQFNTIETKDFLPAAYTS